MVVSLSRHLYLNMLHWALSFYHLAFGDESVRVLGIYIWNHLHQTLRASLSFQIFKRSLNDRFIPKWWWWSLKLSKDV